MSALLLCVLLGASPTQPSVAMVTLDNGMQWLLVPRHGVPRIGGVVMVHGGSVDEKPGATGAAHLFEHLAFAGTPFIGSPRGWAAESPIHDETLAVIEELAQFEKRGEGNSYAARALQARLIHLEDAWLQKGASESLRDLFHSRSISSNAFTEKTVTGYIADLPSSELRTWLAAEAQRFAAPVLRGYRVERSVVVQELHDRASRREAMHDRLFAAAFPDSGQAWPVIGREGDVRALAPSDLLEFRQRFYAPHNAVGCLVGDFEVPAATALLQQTFGVLERRSVDTHGDVRIAQPSQVRLQGPARALTIAFPMPARSMEEWRSAAVAAFALVSVLSEGEPSRSGVKLVGTWFGPGEWAPHLFLCEFEVPDAMSLANAESLVFEHLSQLSPTPAQIQTAAQRMALQEFAQSSTRVGLAQALARSQLLLGQWSSAFWDPEQLQSSEVLAAFKSRFQRDVAFVVEQEVTP